MPSCERRTHARLQIAPPMVRGGREFVFADEDFLALRSLVKELTGINLTDAKRELVYGRLSRRLRVLGLPSFRAYREYIEAAGPGELVELCNAITTNLTSFFREAHHFDHLSAWLGEWSGQGGAERRLRIWSAGCSSGEEAYSIAMTVAEVLPEWQRRDVRVLATDLDSTMVERGRTGRYGEDRVGPLSPGRLTRFFERCTENGRSAWEVGSELRSLVTFRQLNLMHPFPMRGPIDLIFCRNVIIYFDKQTQRELFARIARVQRTRGRLFLGHSESLFKVSDAYRLLGKTIYERV
jgi:chemotaxis protein methyltransferase CheR